MRPRAVKGHSEGASPPTVGAGENPGGKAVVTHDMRGYALTGLAIRKLEWRVTVPLSDWIDLWTIKRVSFHVSGWVAILAGYFVLRVSIALFVETGTEFAHNLHRLDQFFVIAVLGILGVQLIILFGYRAWREIDDALFIVAV